MTETNQNGTEANSTVHESATPEKAKAEFLKIADKQEDDSGDTLKKFLYAMDYLTANFRSFGAADVFNSLRQFDVEQNEIQRLLNLWVSTMERLNKIEVVNSVYDSPQYLVI